MTQQVTVSPFVDLTGSMTGTTASWPWEVSNVYVNGTSTAFSWTGGTLSIPSYTAGVVLAEFGLYLIYDAPSQILPKDPTDSTSSPVYWENRLSQFFQVSVGIKSFETGLTEVSGGSLTIRIDDDWIRLVTELLIFSNRTIRIYTDGVISYKGITTKMDISDYALTIQVQKRQTILEAELNWGDPDYLNKIDRTTNTPYYNGANIPTDYQGQAIPMLFGDQFPYEQDDDGEVDLGTANPALFATPVTNKRSSRSVSTSSAIVKVIPTGSGTGILGRMPSWQTISSVPINQALTGAQHSFGRAEQGSNTVILTKFIKGQVCTLERTSGANPIINSARYYANNAAGTRALFNLGADDTTYTAYEVLKDCDENIHWFPGTIPTTTWTQGAVLSGTFTPGGHRWITVSSLTGVDLKTDELYCVITAITGARSAVEVLKFALESHGYTVDTATFTALAADLPYKTVQKAGDGKNQPTLGDFISEINRSLMTCVVFPASNDSPFLVKIDPNRASTATLDETQIAGLKINHEYRDQAKYVEYFPKYAKSDAQKTSLYLKQSSSMGSLFASERTIGIDHVLISVPTARWQTMTEFYGSPTSTISFTVLDDSVSIELADCVLLNHPACSKKIIITSIVNQPIGRQIQGRYLYVNNS